MQLTKSRVPCENFYENTRQEISPATSSADSGSVGRRIGIRSHWSDLNHCLDPALARSEPSMVAGGRRCSGSGGGGGEREKGRMRDKYES
ncbi:hypothetical protein RND71_001525 [Anisodus tanguticus]|uniref:Uncharacterized protein n=1 Tax=Anisodus tanguticus TaxID=243964 RepID=A0AAE1SY67_9SOLA|nr:hypothetical protein RND71_001525 [Anisodus tanguticus]